MVTLLNCYAPIIAFSLLQIFNTYLLCKALWGGRSE